MTTETTSTDVEVLPAVGALAPLAANPTQTRQQQLEALRAEAEFLEIAAGLAEKACSGQLVAAHFRGKPADGAIAIAYGSSLGWHWTKSLQDVYVVNGKPAIQSKEMRELLIRAGHEVWEEEVGPTRVVLAGRRRGSEIVVRVEWTIEKAETAKLTSNPNYTKFPENMLYARCTTDLAKRLAPDALSGLGILEELQDMSYSDGQLTRARSERGGRGVDSLRQRAIAAANGGAADELQAEMLTTPTETRRKWLNRMFQLLGEGNCTDRDDQLIVIKAAAKKAAQPIEALEHRDGMTDEQLRAVVTQLNQWDKAGQLADQIREALHSATLAAENVKN